MNYLFLFRERTGCSSLKYFFSNRDPLLTCCKPTVALWIQDPKSFSRESFPCITINSFIQEHPLHNILLSLILISCYNKDQGATMVSTGVIVSLVACRGFRWPRKNLRFIDAKDATMKENMGTVVPMNFIVPPMPMFLAA